MKQITAAWKAPTLSFTISMYMKKNSLFTRFISYKISKLAETGITNSLSKRHVISEPNCKPIQNKGQKISKFMFHKISSQKKRTRVTIFIQLLEKCHYERCPFEIF